MFGQAAAVIGTGFIGPVHVEGLIRAGVRVVGILGSTPQKSQEAANKLGLERGYASLDELLDDHSVGVVHIASPNRAHFEQVQACLAAGKHVLCEKPLAMNSQESRKLVEEAKSSQLVCGVNYNIRFYPLCIEAASRIRQGCFGKLYHVSGSYTQDWLLHPTDFNWRVLASEGGSLRALADIGTHWLDLAQFVSGLEVDSLCADLQTVHATRHAPVGGALTFTNPSLSSSSLEGAKSENRIKPMVVDTEDYGSVLLRFKGGAHGLFYVSQVMAGRKNCLELTIAGEKSSLSWNSQEPNRMWIGHRNEPNQELIRDPSLLGPDAQAHANYPGGHNEGFPDSFKQLFRSYYEYVDSDRSVAPKFPTFEDGHREILLCEAILQSVSSKGWVSV